MVDLISSWACSKAYSYILVLISRGRSRRVQDAFRDKTCDISPGDDELVASCKGSSSFAVLIPSLDEHTERILWKMEAHMLYEDQAGRYSGSEY